jgi:crotonobetainyl-CoA:carnitine CoA-transferase CaiB-like acyl-CoA transferase
MIPLGPVFSINEEIVDAHLLSEKFRTPGVWRRPAPALGEHTDEILGELGIDREAIQALRDTRCVG